MMLEDATMAVIAPLRRVKHSNHFRAYGLRGVSTLIDLFIGEPCCARSKPMSASAIPKLSLSTGDSPLRMPAENSPDYILVFLRDLPVLRSTKTLA
jgi:hypothetical protein